MIILISITVTLFEHYICQSYVSDQEVQCDQRINLIVFLSF